MSEAAGIELPADLRATAVARLFEQTRRWGDGQMPPTIIDLATVQKSDSSALALLLEWQSRARQAGREIIFRNPPDTLKVLASLSQVETLLGWSTNLEENS